MAPRDNVGWIWSDAHLLEPVLFFFFHFGLVQQKTDVSSEDTELRGAEQMTREEKIKKGNIQTRLSPYIQHKLSAATPETMTFLFCISTSLWYTMPSFSPSIFFSSEVKAYFFKKHFWRDPPRWASELLTHFETISVTLTYIVPHLKAQTLGSFSPTISCAFPHTHAASTEALWNDIS